MLKSYFCYIVFQLISQRTRYFENNIIKLRFALLITGNVIFFTLLKQYNRRSDLHFTKPAIKHFIRHLCTNQLLAYNSFFPIILLLWYVYI